MKKVISLILVTALSLAIFTGCKPKENTNPQSNASSNTSGVAKTTKLIVGASIVPHAEILNFAKDLLLEKGVELVVKEYTDYVQPNLAVKSGDLDANYFQHKPYLDKFNVEKEANLVSVAPIHYEPFGVYPGKTKALADIKDDATVAVPNDASNEARALLLLEQSGLIKLKANAGIQATVKDIVENQKNLKIKEIESAQLARSLKDVDFAAINGNYALQAGLNAKTDAFALEASDSVSAQTYANIIAVKEGRENDAAIKALVEVLQSKAVKDFITEKYEGTVIPL